MIDFLNLKAVNEPLAAHMQAAITRVLERGQYVLGQECAAFEQEFARYIGAGYAVGTGNGLDALEMGIRACGFAPGSEIIVPANTYIASVLAIVHNQCVPVFAEPSPETFNLDPESLLACITSRTRAVLAVHLYGQISDWDRIEAIAAEHRLVLIEDAAQAHGAVWKGRKAGHLGRVAAFSFYPTKNLGALGDAGCVTTDDPAVAESVRQQRNYGLDPSGICCATGRNSRLDEIQAAVLSTRLPRLDSWNTRRRQLALRYRRQIVHPAVTLPAAADEHAHVWHQFVIRTSRRDHLRAFLAEQGIGTLIHYRIPPHRQKPLASYATRPLPVTEQLCGEILSLPLNTALSDEQADCVIDCINRWKA